MVCLSWHYSIEKAARHHAFNFIHPSINNIQCILVMVDSSTSIHEQERKQKYEHQPWMSFEDSSRK